MIPRCSESTYATSTRFFTESTVSPKRIFARVTSVLQMRALLIRQKNPECGLASKKQGFYCHLVSNLDWSDMREEIEIQAVQP